jgi:hypothetical protein
VIDSKASKENKTRETTKVGRAKEEEHWKNPRNSRYEAALLGSLTAEVLKILSRQRNNFRLGQRRLLPVIPTPGTSQRFKFMKGASEAAYW